MKVGGNMGVPNLIVMLTHNDMTVSNASDVFEQCKNAYCEYFGMKEESLPPNEMKRLFEYMKSCGKKTVLEVVAYTHEECVKGAKLAKYCGCDILMGTIYSDDINEFCHENGILYMPFIGDIQGRPSILTGSIDDMVEQANFYSEKNVFGVDLLGYRYTGNAFELNSKVVAGANTNVCLAGSVNSFQRVDEVRAINPWAFTIGSAFFEKKFGGSFTEQIDAVQKCLRR